jgi:hypothetical protein
MGAELVSKRARSFVRNLPTYPLDRLYQRSSIGRKTALAHTRTPALERHFWQPRVVASCRCRCGVCSGGRLNGNGAASPKTCGGVSLLSSVLGAKHLSTASDVVVS